MRIFSAYGDQRIYVGGLGKMLGELRIYAGRLFGVTWQHYHYHCRIYSYILPNLWVTGE